MREPEDVEAEFGEASEDVVADAGSNADLYAANQGSTGMHELDYAEAEVDFGLQQANHLETAPNQHCLLELHDAGKCGVISIVLQLTLSGATANMYVHVWFTIGEGAKQAVN